MNVIKLFSLAFCLTFFSFLCVGQEENKLQQAFQYLLENNKKLKIEKSDIDNFVVNHTYTDENTKATYIYLDQTYQGIPIKNAMMVMVMNKNGKIIHTGNSCVEQLSKIEKITASGILPSKLVVSAAQHLGVERPEEPSTFQRSNGGEIVFAKTSYVKSDIKARPIYEYDDKKNQIILCYEITMDMANSADYWQISVAQGSSDYIAKNNLTVYCTHTHNKWQHQENCEANQIISKDLAPKSKFQELVQNAPKYRVYPFPAESPNHGSHQLLTDPSIKVASPEGWNMIDGKGVNTTRGNNTTTFLDEDDNDQQDAGTAVAPLDSVIFDFPHDINQDPNLFKQAAQVNLFYANNMMHDLTFLYGFTEVAGNFQTKNYSGQGKGTDAVVSQAFDGFKASTPKLNNANFSTPIDGNSGRMQMFLWDRSAGAVSITAPVEIARDVTTYGVASFGPSLPLSTEKAIESQIQVVRQTGTAFPTQGCQAISQVLTGKIALVDRGECNFIDKVNFAQRAGAVACIVCNVAGINGGNGEEIIAMGPPPNSTLQINIPSIFLRKSDCDRIRSVISRGSDVVIKLQESTLVGPRYRDASFDNGIIAHEYGHGISNRLTGGPNNSSCLNNDEQMGEGWSDFFSLITSVKAGDKGSLKRGIGTYSINEPVDGDGIRRFPYSTDMKINPQTFNAIKGTTAPHPLGEVWADMLWDLYWAMADKYGFDPDITNINSGNGKAIQLVMEGMKIQACRPGFIEGRDAIVGADLLLFNGENSCLIWEVFAKRGLGHLAFGGSSNNRNDGIENFEVLPTCIEKLKISKKFPQIVETGTTIGVELRAINHIPKTVKNVFIEDDIPVGYEYVAGSSNKPATVQNGKLRILLGDMNYEDVQNITYKLNVVGPKSTTKTLYNVDSGVDGFNIIPKVGFETWSIVNEGAKSGKEAFFIPVSKSENDHALITPSIQISGQKPVLKFFHKYNTRPIVDGGYVSISTDNGVNWENLDSQFLVNGPNETINYGTFAIPNLKGFTGTTKDVFIDSYADLSAYKGKSVQVRFRFGTTDTTTFINGGWWIDDIEIMDALTGVTLACINDEVKDKLACTGESIVIVNSSVSTNTLDKNIADFTIYPNPAMDNVNIVIETEESSEASIKVYTYDGSLKIQLKNSLLSGVNVVPLDISSLNQGIYFVEVGTKNFSSIKKIIKAQ